MEKRTRLLAQSDRERRQGRPSDTPAELRQKMEESLTEHTTVFLRLASGLPQEYVETVRSLDSLTEKVVEFGVDGVRFVLGEFSADLCRGVSAVFGCVGWRDWHCVVGFCLAVAEFEVFQSEEGTTESADIQGYTSFALKDESFLPNLMSYLEKLLGFHMESGLNPPPFPQVQQPISDCLSVLSQFMDADCRVARFFVANTGDKYQRILSITNHRIPELRLDLMHLMHSLVHSERMRYVKLVTSKELTLACKILADSSLSLDRMEACLLFIMKILDSEGFEDEIPFIKMASFLLDIDLEKHLLRILTLPQDSFQNEMDLKAILCSKCRAIKIITSLTSYDSEKEAIEDPIRFLTAEITKELVHLATTTGRDQSAILQAEALQAISNIVSCSNSPATRYVEKNYQFWVWSIRQLHESSNPKLLGYISGILLNLEPMFDEQSDIFNDVGGWTQFADICLRAAETLEQCNSSKMAYPVQLVINYTNLDDLSKTPLTEAQQRILTEWSMNYPKQDSDPETQSHSGFFGNNPNSTNTHSGYQHRHHLQGHPSTGQRLLGSASRALLHLYYSEQHPGDDGSCD